MPRTRSSKRKMRRALRKISHALTFYRIIMRPKKKNCDKVLKAMRSPIILILGKSRSGKGFQISRMVRRYRLYHIDFFQLVRNEVRRGTQIGRIMEDTILAKGSLIPRIIALKLIKKVMCTYVYEYSGFILEGYPRNLQECIDFENEICNFSRILYLELPDFHFVPRVIADMPGKGDPSNTLQVLVTRSIRLERRIDPILQYYSKIALILNGVRHPDRLNIEVMDIIDELFEMLEIPGRSRLE